MVRTQSSLSEQVVNPDPCGSKVPTARGLVLTLLLNSYDDPAYLAKAKVGTSPCTGLKRRAMTDSLMDRLLDRGSGVGEGGVSTHCRGEQNPSCQRRARADDRHLPLGAIGGGFTTGIGITY